SFIRFFAFCLSIYTTPSYCFVIGANFANNRLIPVGAGKATSTSISSPSPVTFTIVPIPHLLCFALSPTFHVAFSAPVVVIFSAFFRGGTDCDERFGLERLFFNI